MTIQKQVDLRDIVGVQFRCQCGCGGGAVMNVTDRGIACDIDYPDVEIRVLMMPIRPGDEPWTSWVLSRADDPDIPEW